MRADRSDSAEFLWQVCRGNGVWENISNTVCKVFAGALSDFTITRLFPVILRRGRLGK